MGLKGKSHRSWEPMKTETFALSDDEDTEAIGFSQPDAKVPSPRIDTLPWAVRLRSKAASWYSCNDPVYSYRHPTYISQKPYNTKHLEVGKLRPCHLYLNNFAPYMILASTVHFNRIDNVRLTVKTQCPATCKFPGKATVCQLMMV